MLKIENLRKVFRTDEIETIALDNVSFAIEKGEFVAVMGPSGCGKSTLLNILGLLDNPTSGSYTLLGQEVSAFREKDRTLFRKGNIGFVFQSFNLIGWGSIVTKSFEGSNQLLVGSPAKVVKTGVRWDGRTIKEYMKGSGR